MEIFKDIEGYEGLYQISSYGNLKSLSKPRSENQQHIITSEKLLKPGLNGWGYKHITLVKNKHHTMKTIHRLVCIAFHSNPENKPCVNHKDFNRINNHVENLEWCTYKENISHAMDNGRMDWTKPCRGEKSGRSKLTEDNVRDIKTHLKNRTKTQIQLSREYNVTTAAIYFIKDGVNWAHITI